MTAKSVWRRVRHFVWGEEPQTKAEKRLLLKIDWFILSYCCLMVRPSQSPLVCTHAQRMSLLQYFTNCA